MGVSDRLFPFTIFALSAISIAVLFVALFWH
jgi:hypothetical protein